MGRICETVILLSRCLCTIANYLYWLTSHGPLQWSLNVVSKQRCFATFVRFHYTASVKGILSEEHANAVSTDQREISDFATLWRITISHDDLFCWRGSQVATTMMKRSLPNFCKIRRTGKNSKDSIERIHYVTSSEKSLMCFFRFFKYKRLAVRRSIRQTVGFLRFGFWKTRNYSTVDNKWLSPAMNSLQLAAFVTNCTIDCYRQNFWCTLLYYIIDITPIECHHQGRYVMLSPGLTKITATCSTTSTKETRVEKPLNSRARNIWQW